MKTSRRKFIGSSSALAVGAALATLSPHTTRANSFAVKELPNDQFDPWIEIIPEAARFNINVLHRLSNKPIIAVIKNNGYGLGAEIIAGILDDMPQVAGFAAVKTDACLSLRESGIKKPVLHMGMATEKEFYDLAANNIELSIYSDNIRRTLEAISTKINRKIKVHQYIDTGMSRMGIPYHKALPWMQDIAESSQIEVLGSFMCFTEDKAYDQEQLRRFMELVAKAKTQRIDMGKLHAASSNAIYHFPESTLDMVRPGITIYGAYPTYPEKEKAIGALKVAYRLNARVVRIVHLRTGDSVSYGREYTAEKPTWIATLPIGHADGYIRKAVNGAKVLIGKKVYPVIGAVSASHTILEIGNEPEVKIGDVATLIGPDHEEIHPSHISTVTGVSVYDILMHMNANLPKLLI